jgi:hypothetical protein
MAPRTPTSAWGCGGPRPPVAARRAAAGGALRQLLCARDSQRIARRKHMLAFQLPAACVTESAVPPSVSQRAVSVRRHAARAAGPLNELCNPRADQQRAFRRMLRHSPSQHRPSKRRGAARRGKWRAAAPAAALHVLCSTLFAPHFALCRVQRTAATPAAMSSPGTPARSALGAAPRRLQLVTGHRNTQQPRALRASAAGNARCAPCTHVAARRRGAKVARRRGAVHARLQSRVLY